MTRILSRIRNTLKERPQLEWLIPALLCAVLLGQLLLSARRLSQTADEATHLYSGYRYLRCGDLTVSPEHPPLAKIIAAAPLLPLDVAVNCAPFKGSDVEQAFAGLNWFYAQNWRAALLRARVAVSVFAIALCVLVWIAARRMFGLATAVLATVLVIFEPNVLAYGGLVLTDVPVTCMLLFSVFGFYLWVSHRTAPFLMLTGLAAGLTLLAKHSGVVVIPILGTLAIIDALVQPDGGPPKWKVAVCNLLPVALMLAIAFGTVWAGYGMRFASHPGANHVAEAKPAASSAVGRGLPAIKEHRLLPEAYVDGFSGALVVANQNPITFVAGEIRLQAPWFSTPFNFLIRSTPALLALMAVSIAGVVLALRKSRREFLFLLFPAAIYLAMCLQANINVAARYLLPMLPFLLIAVAAGCMELARQLRWVKYVVPCLVALHAASSLHAYPSYLSYANDLWGGPAKAYKYQSWVDIGQAYPEAKAYLEHHPTRDCWFLTGWQWDPGLYNVPCRAFGVYLSRQIPPRVHGTVIVSSTLLTDVRLVEGNIVAAFKNASPKGRIGGSALLVYEGDFDTSLAAAKSEEDQASYASATGQFSAAVEHGKRAVELAPASALAHAQLCAVLAPVEPAPALAECATARNLLLQDPLRQEPIRKRYLKDLDDAIISLRSNYRNVYGREPEIGLAAESPAGR